jgi:hypothetical protein
MRIPGAFLAATVLTLMLVSGTAAKPSDPFTGVWTSIDTDGSNQTISFGGPGSLRFVHYFDDGASACGWPDINVTATLNGIGTVSGDTLTTDLTGQCNGGTGGDLDSGTVTYTYDSSTNTLLDSFGVTWYR